MLSQWDYALVPWKIYAISLAFPALRQFNSHCCVCFVWLFLYLSGLNLISKLPYFLSVCIAAIIMAFNWVTTRLDIKGQVSEYSHSVPAWRERRRLTTESTPNEIPSWELCKYFRPLPRPADRLIPLTFLINHWGVESGWDGRNWKSGHTTVVGNCPHQHPVCNPTLSSNHIHI